jgi:UDP-N-acetylglucosamine--N-acetylmuramyl-(pentapeptide) pyrophosphoryl-undecaprenol N-acetylglucosamine transferase
VNVLVSGGGTAGHVFPALALAHRLVEDHGAQVRFVGTTSGQEARLVPEAGFAFDAVDARPLRRDLSLETLAAPIAAVRSISACRPLVERADVVVGMGGYVSVPVGLAAARARRPLVLHEQNAVPGLANRLLSRRAHTVALTFAEAAAKLPRRAHTAVTGNPVRASVLRVIDEREALVKEAFEELDLEPGHRTLVVFGGSQGALHVNLVAVDAIARLQEREDLQVLMLTGTAHERRVAEALPPGPLRVRVRGFLERMELAYAVADLVVARAGATSCAELSICGVPSVLVPYPHATGRHQEANARALERAGGARVVMDDALSGRSLAATVVELLDESDRLASMADRMRSWSRPDAASALAAVVREAGGAR